MARTGGADGGGWRLQILRAVELPSNDALQNSVRRPTVWDGLQFDQFKAVEDPAQSFGVTSGGTAEVVVAPTAFSACVIKRNVGM